MREKPTYHRLTLSAIWFLTAPSVIFLFLILPFISMDRWHTLPSDCAGCMGLMFLAAPIIIVVAKAGFVISAVIAAILVYLVSTPESPRKLKIETSVALGFSLLAAIVAHIRPW